MPNAGSSFNDLKMNAANQQSNARRLDVERVDNEISVEELQLAIDELLSELTDGSDMHLGPTEELLRQQYVATGSSLSVSLTTEGEGADLSLVDHVITIVSQSGLAYVIAYDVWKKIILVQLEHRFGKPALREKAGPGKHTPTASGNHASN